MKEIRILFTGVGRRVELVQAFREASLHTGINLKIYGADMADTAPALAFCDCVRRVCGMRDKSYIPELLQICENDAIDLLIPTIDTDLLVLSENSALFASVGTKVLISAPEMIRICRDKNLTSQFFRDCGLKAPLPVNDWRKYADGFPAFIKPKDGSSSINAFRVESEKELEVYASQIEDYVIQRFVDGAEYTVDIFCDFESEPIFITPRIRLAVRAGEVLKTQIALDQPIIDECRAIIERFRPCGPITVQLIREKSSGEDYYIEINPRYGGGAPLSMKAGAKSAEAVLKMLTGESVKYCSTIANNAVYSRFDQSVCVTEGTSEIKGVIFDLDDTLYGEKEYVRSGFHAVSDFLGGGFEQRLWDCFESGKPALDTLLRELGRENEIATALEVYRSHVPDIRLYPGVIELLETLKKRGIRVGIITDGRPAGQRNKLKALGLDRLIEDIIITDELGGPQFRKPNDISFRIMQNRWRIPFEQLVYVGDNPTKDFQAAKQLGMHWIWLKNENGLYARASEAFYVNGRTARDIRELQNVFALPDNVGSQ